MWPHLSTPQAIMLLTMLFGSGVALKVLSVVRKILLVIEGIGFPDPATGLFKRVDELEETIDVHDDALVAMGRIERRRNERRHLQQHTQTTR